MIRFEKVTINYSKMFASLYEFSFDFTTHTLLIGDRFDTFAPFRILTKLDNFYTGNIYIDDINLKQIKPQDLPIAYLPSDVVLFKHKSIFFNLYYPLKIRKVKLKDAKSIILPLLQQFNLDSKTKTKNLSLSKQKLVMLLRALIRQPKYVLIEHIYQDIEPEDMQNFEKIINQIKQHSIILASETTPQPIYADFAQLKLLD